MGSEMGEKKGVKVGERAGGHIPKYFCQGTNMPMSPNNSGQYQMQYTISQFRSILHGVGVGDMPSNFVGPRPHEIVGADMRPTSGPTFEAESGLNRALMSGLNRAVNVGA